MSQKTPFDDFLKKGAGRFEIQPGKMAFQKIRSRTQRKVHMRFILPMVLLGLFLSGIYLEFYEAPSEATSNIALSPISVSTPLTAKVLLPFATQKSQPINSSEFKKSKYISLTSSSQALPSGESRKDARWEEDYIIPRAASPSELQLQEVPKPLAVINPVRPIPFQKRKINWKLYAGTGFAFRHLQYRNRNIYNPHSFTNVDGFDWKQHQGIQGFVAGLTVDIPLTAKTYIKAGLQFFAGGYDIQNKFTSYQPLGMSALPVEEQIRSQYRIMFGEIPLAWGYNVYHPKYTIHWEGGVNLSTKIYQSIPEAVGLLGREYSVWNGTPRLLGVTAQLSPGVAFRWGKQPVVMGLDLRYQLTSTYVKTYPVKEHLYFAGLRTGIVF